MPDSEEITPNVVVPNPQARRQIGIVLYIVSLVAGVGAMFFLFFPELAYGTDIPARVVAFINALVSFISGAFGLGVTVPNIPKVVPRGDAG